MWTTAALTASDHMSHWELEPHRSALRQHQTATEAATTGHSHTQHAAVLQLSKHRGDARRGEELMYKYPGDARLQARAGFSLCFPRSLASAKTCLMFDHCTARREPGRKMIS